MPVDQRAHHGRKSQDRAHREIDSSRQNDEMLSRRQNGNGRGLRQNITEIARGKKIVRAEAQSYNKEGEDQPGPELQSAKAELDKSGRGGFTSFVVSNGVLRGMNPVRFQFGVIFRVAKAATARVPDLFLAGKVAATCPASKKKRAERGLASLWNQLED